MIRDYGNRRNGMARPGRGGREPGGLLPASIGALPVLPILAMVVLVGCLWLAWWVQSGRDEMAVEQARQEKLLQQHRQLSQRYDELLAPERIEAEAAELGLYPPREGQVQRP